MVPDSTVEPEIGSTDTEKSSKVPY